jgi:hypothetical protein
MRYIRRGGDCPCGLTAGCVAGKWYIFFISTIYRRKIPLSAYTSPDWFQKLLFPQKVTQNNCV